MDDRGGRFQLMYRELIVSLQIFDVFLSLENIVVGASAWHVQRCVSPPPTHVPQVRRYAHVLQPINVFVFPGLSNPMKSKPSLTVS